ncbi:P-loop containing nucleoside triphosphate hydrolase protein [Coniochaeta sp. 2T2.1]|nr:P-loop containing nucleoside triphosphate hydrolase protein [Coniochaeta sp. 2T2.1]
MIHFCRDPDFVDRGNILTEIASQCPKPPYRVALVGLGGVGKSQLVIEHAHRVSDGDADIWVLWVYAETRARAEESFKTIADMAKLPDRNDQGANIFQIVCSWLASPRSGRWLMILDSADHDDVFYGDDGSGQGEKSLASYLPQNANGSIIITTRDRSLASRLTGHDRHLITVGPMSEADAVTLLERKLATLSDTDRLLAVDLVRSLDLVPLAISQAAAYIRKRQPRTSLEKYLTEFRKGERRQTWLLQHEADDLRRDGGASNSILTTWEISFEHIRRRRPSAAHLLSLMSFFDRQGIPEEVVSPSKRAYLAKLAKLGKDCENDQFEDDVEVLRAYSLIGVDAEGDLFEMHGLVQLSTRRWLEATGQYRSLQLEFIERLAVAFPAVHLNTRKWVPCQRLLPHVEMAVRYAPANLTTGVFRSLLGKAAWYAYYQDNYELSERLCRTSSVAAEAAETSKLLRGPDHDLTISILMVLASVYASQGRHAEAEKLQADIENSLIKTRGPDDERTLEIKRDRAITLYAMGHSVEAERILTPVVQAFKSKFGEQMIQSMEYACDLALIFTTQQGRLAEAEEILVQMAETYKSRLGTDHPRTLQVMSRLARSVYLQNRLVEAEKLYVQVIEASKKKLGPDYITTSGYLWNLARVITEQGRLEEAEQIYQEILVNYERICGPDNPDTLRCSNNLADLWLKQGRLQEAEKHLARTMRIQMGKFGTDRRQTLNTMNSLSLTWWDQCRKADALVLMQRVMDGRQRHWGEDHWSTKQASDKVEEWSKDTGLSSSIRPHYIYVSCSAPSK